MILIFSSVYDLDTDEVVRALSLLGKKYLRINDVTIFANETTVRIEPDSGISQLIIGGHTVQIGEVTTVWIRKIGLSDSSPYFMDVSECISGQTKGYQYKEYTSFLHFLFGLFKKCYWPVGRRHMSLNKLDILQEARDSGFLIPETLLTNRLNPLKSFFSSNSHEVITKAITNAAAITYDDFGIILPTQKITVDHLAHLPDSFIISKFQKRIKKKFDARVFVFQGDCYAMAILSQLDPQTAVDFRKYNTDKPNRCIPIKLQKEVQKKIRRFMKAVALDTGSIDFIVDHNDDYHFLEVNPFGIINMIEEKCNYNIPDRIARGL